MTTATLIVAEHAHANGLLQRPAHVQIPSMSALECVRPQASDAQAVSDVQDKGQQVPDTRRIQSKNLAQHEPLPTARGTCFETLEIATTALNGDWQNPSATTCHEALQPNTHSSSHAGLDPTSKSTYHQALPRTSDGQQTLIARVGCCRQTVATMCALFGACAHLLREDASQDPNKHKAQIIS
jgi:hypothetical protein